MLNHKFSSLLFLSLFPISNSLASGTAPGYLTEFNYQVSNLSSMAEAQALMDSEMDSVKGHSICANRAEVWSYIMNKTTQVKTGKVFMFFTDKGQAKPDKEWAWHVAPYVLVNGQEVVLDSGFDVFQGKPALLADWTEQFVAGQKCRVLDPVHNPKHLEYEQNNMGDDESTPLEDNGGSPRKYPSEEAHCYLRKVPMYYVYPNSIYGADLALTGHSGYEDFIFDQFEKLDVLAACRQAMSSTFRLVHSCARYLNFK